MRSTDKYMFYEDSVFIPNDKVDIWINGVAPFNSGEVGRCSGTPANGLPPFFDIHYYVKGVLLLAYYRGSEIEQVKDAITEIIGVTT